MATPIHGRSGRLYAAVASGGTAEPIANMTKWSMNQAVDTPEATVFGDTNKVYVAGLPDASGAFAGFLDTATPQLYTAATDGVPRKLYLYPTLALATTYWFGTGIFDFAIDVDVSGIVSISGNWKAASSIQKVTA